MRQTSPEKPCETTALLDLAATRLVKITWRESPTFADSNEVIFKVFKQPFIKMDLQIRKSYKFCYEAKLNFLDWASCATPLKPGRKFSTYLAQSKLLFGEFIQNFHQILLNP